MTTAALAGKRILVTHADAFMGPVLGTVLAEQGATVIADTHALRDAAEPAAVVAAAGHIDVLVINLAWPRPDALAHEAGEDEWEATFAALVHPLPRLVRAVLPQMLARRAGKILLMGSAAALRGRPRTTTYSAARGAQLAYMQSLGIEVAPHNIQANAIAQNFVENPTYFPPEVQAQPKFQQILQQHVPLGRLVGAREDASFAAYLCSDAANCFVGQTFPVCGGWVMR